MASYRAADSKREEFRKYLEKAGVIDALTKVLVNLYEEPEKPNNALEFMYQHLSGGGPDTADTAAMKTDLIELKTKVAQLMEENDELRSKLEKYEPTATDESVNQ